MLTHMCVYIYINIYIYIYIHICLYTLLRHRDFDHLRGVLLSGAARSGACSSPRNKRAMLTG